jgi:hypothetical protein
LSGQFLEALLRCEVVGGTVPTLTYRTDTAAFSRLVRTHLGKTILFSDNDTWTNEEIVAGYRAQNQIESALRDLENPHFLGRSPLCHWTDSKIRVHAFDCVLALEYRPEACGLEAIQEDSAAVSWNVLITARTIETVGAPALDLFRQTGLRVGACAAQAIVDLRHGRRPQHVVNPEVFLSPKLRAPVFESDDAEFVGALKHVCALGQKHGVASGIHVPDAAAATRRSCGVDPRSPVPSPTETTT